MANYPITPKLTKQIPSTRRTGSVRLSLETKWTSTIYKDICCTVGFYFAKVSQLSYQILYFGPKTVLIVVVAEYCYMFSVAILVRSHGAKLTSCISSMPPASPECMAMLLEPFPKAARHDPYEHRNSPQEESFQGIYLQVYQPGEPGGGANIKTLFSQRSDSGKGVKTFSRTPSS